MHSSVQALADEVARLRSECAYVSRALDALDTFSAYAAYVTDKQDDEISRGISVHHHDAQDNLERASDDLRDWTYAVNEVLRSLWRPPV